MMRRKSLFVVLVLALAVALASGALAQALGPIDPENGYPEYVQDINGVQLDLPTPPYGDGVTAPTMIFEPPIVGNTLSEATGFGAEAFFFLANSVITFPNGGRAVLDLGIEAAYGSGEPDPLSPPDQFLFSRVRVRFDATVAGTYTVTHPWGEENLVVTDADVGQRFTFVYDWGGFAPSDATIPAIPSSFERILISPTPWRFLVPAEKVTLSGQEGYVLGDGVTPTTVTGGFNGVNSFTITGPANAFGPAVSSVASLLFTVSGHIAGEPPPDPAVQPPPPPQQPTTDVVTITRARLRGAQVEVRATSQNGFPMTAQLYSGGVNGILVGSGNLGTNGRGNLTFDGTLGNPDTVRVHSTSTNPNILGGEAIALVTN